MESNFPLPLSQFLHVLVMNDNQVLLQQPIFIQNESLVL